MLDSLFTCEVPFMFAIKVSPKVSDEFSWFNYIITNSDVDICNFVELLLCS